MDEATRLLPRFYIGSAPSRNAGFSYIVLCAKEYQPDHRLLHPATIHRIPLEDTEEPLSPRLKRILEIHGRQIAEAWENGHRVLVSCVMGRNRSALLSSLALAEISGEHPGTTADFVRETRIDPNGVRALENPIFWYYLQSYPR